MRIDRFLFNEAVARAASEVFEPDDDGHGAVLHGGEVAAGQEDAARRAANNCPERAITVEE